MTAPTARALPIGRILGWSVLSIATLLVLTFVSAGDLPSIRSQNQLNDEVRLWVKNLEACRASGQAVSFFNDGSANGRKNITDIIGPFIPYDRVEYVWLKADGTFGLKFKVKYRIDFPLLEGGYIRIKLDDQEIRGGLAKAQTQKDKIPVKLLVFYEPHTIQIDRLGSNRESTVSPVGKLLGLLPHIVALVYYEKDGLPYAGPQLDGMGASENPRIMRELLGLDDTLMPEGFLTKDK
jgi:hypothetical protein